jgi:hypothetical protein
MTDLLLPALGLVLLFMGRRLFWFFVAVAGFAAGLQAAPLLFGSQPFWMVWAVGLGCGVFGALLALFFQQVAIAVGGFLAGVTIALHLLSMLNPNTVILIGLVCGIAGAVALFLFFDWVLVFLSSLVGATLVMDSIGWQLPYGMLIYLVLAGGGIAVQAKWLLARRATVR